MSAWKSQYLTRGLCPARALVPSRPQPTHFAQLDLFVVIDVVVWVIISSTATLTLCIYPDSRWLISVLHYLVVFTNYLHSGCARKRKNPVIFSSYRLVPGQRASIETVVPSSGPAILRGTKWADIMVNCLGPYPWYQFLGWYRPVLNNFTETPALSTEGRKRCPLFILLSNSFFMDRCFMWSNPLKNFHFHLYNRFLSPADCELEKKLSAKRYRSNNKEGRKKATKQNSVSIRRWLTAYSKWSPIELPIKSNP